MSLQQIRKEILSLKNSFITPYEPSCMLFIFDDGLTCEGLTTTDVDRYEEEHLHTHVVGLEVEDMGIPDDN
jgi:hypothetical protein